MSLSGSQSRALLIIRTLSPLHVGAGRGAAFHVDLPVQRDEFGLPTIWASSLKGALRANYDGKDKKILFGPEPGSPEASEYSSALSFTDARLIMIPARTLRGVWAYVTSPHMIYELYKLVGKDAKNIPRPGPDKALVSRQELIVDDRVFVNELDFELIRDAVANIDVLFGDLLDKELIDFIRDRGLVIVSDDSIRQIVNKSMLIQYRVRLSSDTKTVARGALWSEEYVPSEAIFASLIVAKRFVAHGPSEKKEFSADEILSIFIGYLRGKKPSIFVGGRETIGRGMIRVYVTEIKETSSTGSGR